MQISSVPSSSGARAGLQNKGTVHKASSSVGSSKVASHGSSKRPDSKSMRMAQKKGSLNAQQVVVSSSHSKQASVSPNGPIASTRPSGKNAEQQLMVVKAQMGNNGMTGVGPSQTGFILDPQNSSGNGAQVASSALRSSATHYNVSSLQAQAIAKMLPQAQAPMGQFRQRSDLSSSQQTHSIGGKTDSSADSQSRYLINGKIRKSQVQPQKQSMQTGTFELSNQGTAAGTVGGSQTAKPGAHFIPVQTHLHNQQAQLQAYGRSQGSKFVAQQAATKQSQSLVMSRNTSPAKEKLKYGSIDFYQVNNLTTSQSSQKSITTAGGDLQPISNRGIQFQEHHNQQRNQVGLAATTVMSLQAKQPVTHQPGLNRRQNYLANLSQQSNSRSPPQSTGIGPSGGSHHLHPMHQQQNSQQYVLYANGATHQNHQQLPQSTQVPFKTNLQQVAASQNSHVHSSGTGRQQINQKLASNIVSPNNSPRAPSKLTLSDSIEHKTQAKPMRSNNGSSGIPMGGVSNYSAAVSRQQFNNYGVLGVPAQAQTATTQLARGLVCSPEISGGRVFTQISDTGSLINQQDMSHVNLPIHGQVPATLQNTAHPNNPSFALGSSPDPQAHVGPPQLNLSLAASDHQPPGGSHHQAKKAQYKLSAGHVMQHPVTQPGSMMITNAANTKVNSRGSSINRPVSGGVSRQQKAQQPIGGGGSNGAKIVSGNTVFMAGGQRAGQGGSSMQQTNHQVRRPSNKNPQLQQQHHGAKQGSKMSVKNGTGGLALTQQSSLSNKQSQLGVGAVKQPGQAANSVQAKSLKQSQVSSPKNGGSVGITQQPQQSDVQNAAFLDQIQSLIKNGKRHFGKDVEQEALVGQLRELLLGMTNQMGEMPASYDSQTAFNQLIQEMLKLKFSQDAQKTQPGSKGNGPTQRAQSLSSGVGGYQSKAGSGGGTSQGHQRKLVGNPSGDSSANPAQASSKNGGGASQNSRKSKDQKQPQQILKQVKINKPTFNLQINNNVGHVNNSEGGAITMVTKTSTQQQQPNSDLIAGNLNTAQLLEVVKNAAEFQQQQLLAANLKKSKRNSSEDNVTSQLKIQQLRQQAEQEAKKKQDLRVANMQGQPHGMQANHTRRQGPNSGPQGVSPALKPTRKNLPSLANSKSRHDSHSSTNQNASQSTDQPQFAKQIRRGAKTSGTNTNYSSQLNSQQASVSKVGPPTTTGSSSQQRQSSNDQSAKSQLASHAQQPIAAHLGYNTALENFSGGTQGSRVNNSALAVDDTLLKERDELIAYIKNYIAKNNELPPTTLEFYKFVKLIGKGAFGKVTLGMHKLTGKSVAIKTIEKQYMKDDFSKRKVFQEVYLLKKIKHSNVIRLLEVFESSKHLLMVMEYAGGGDLLKLIKKRGGLKEQDSKFIFKQIAYGLSHIHCRSVIHRDIKLDNILLDCEKGVKICDFGVSKIIKKGQVIKEQCGTPAYLAPEIIIDEGYEGFFVDIWSLGVLLFAMLCGTVPFKAPTLDELHKLILAGSFTIPDSLSQDAKDLIHGMIQLEPSKRLTIPQILSHTWLKETNEVQSESDEEDSEEAKKGEVGEGGAKAQDGVGAADSQGKKDGVDLASIQGNVNYVNVDNLFYYENYKNKLSYIDYCCITEDFTSQIIDEEAIKVCENFGFPRHFMVKCLNRGDINHATACYFLLTNSS